MTCRDVFCNMCKLPIYGHYYKSNYDKPEYQ